MHIKYIFIAQRCDASMKALRSIFASANAVDIIADLPLVGRRAGAFLESKPIRKHEHFTFADFELREQLWACFRIDGDLRVGKARSNRQERLALIGNRDEERFLACRTAASAGSHRPDLPTFCHGPL
jgi:hypothetical protein